MNELDMIRRQRSLTQRIYDILNLYIWAKILEAAMFRSMETTAQAFRDFAEAMGVDDEQ